MTKAAELFEKYSAWQEAEDVITDALVGIFKDSEGKVSFHDFTYDGYDTSFELTGVRNGLEPTSEQLQKCWNLGFSRCWLHYTDGSEKYFYRP